MCFVSVTTVVYYHQIKIIKKVLLKDKNRFCSNYRAFITTIITAILSPLLLLFHPVIYKFFLNKSVAQLQVYLAIRL